MYEYKMTLIRVIDGDTVRVMIDHGMQVFTAQNIRLESVYAPELKEEAGRMCKDEVERWFIFREAQNAIFTVRTKKDARSFNRYIGTIAAVNAGEADRTYLNNHMIAFINRSATS